jgi:hypothetical protein
MTVIETVTGTTTDEIGIDAIGLRLLEDEIHLTGIVDRLLEVHRDGSCARLCLQSSV